VSGPGPQSDRPARLGFVVQVLDVHHHHCHNPEQIDTHEAARACLATWQGWDGRPKVHFSSPRTDWGYRYGSDQVPQGPDWKAHAEFADPFAFISFYRPLMHDAPDVMLEAKAKDVALKQLQRDLVRFAPDMAVVFGLGR
jgi:UV DNA damage endonuclease